MPIKKKKTKSISIPQMKSNKNTGLFGLKDYDEIFSGGIVLDLPKMFKYKVK